MRLLNSELQSILVLVSSFQFLIILYLVWMLTRLKHKLSIAERRTKYLSMTVEGSSDAESLIVQSTPRKKRSSRSETETTYPSPVSQFVVEASSHVQQHTFHNVVKKYEETPSVFAEKALIVAETEESIYLRRRGERQFALLKHSVTGSYWLVSEGHKSIILPDPNMRVNPYKMSTVKEIFDCENYTERSLIFRLRCPAVVKQYSSEEWRVIEKGRIEFI